MSKSIPRKLFSIHSSYLSSLQACTTLSHINQAHARMITSGLSEDSQASAHLLHACARARPPDPRYARLLFDRLPSPPAFAWNNLFRAHSRARDSPAVLALFQELLSSSAEAPSGIPFSFVAKACADLANLPFLMAVHAHATTLGLETDPLVPSSLISGYVACGSIDLARKLFDEFPVRDLISWTVVLNGYVSAGCPKEAVDFFFLMVNAKVRPDEVALVAAFTACSRLGNLSLGRKVDSLARSLRISYNTYVDNSLIDMYAKCGSIGESQKLFDRMAGRDVVSLNSMVAGYSLTGDMEAARRLFDRILEKNAVSWSVLMKGYIQNGCFKEALSMFHELRNTGAAPSESTITLAISACAHLGALCLGREIHLGLDENTIESDVVLCTALVDMYVKCGCLEIGWTLFDRIPEKNIVTWNVMIMGLAIHGKASECLELFSKMLENGLRPNSMTFIGILSACAHVGWLEKGKDYFDNMTSVYKVNPCAEHISCIVQLMGQAGLVTEACEFINASTIEPDVAIWGALLSACKAHGYLELGRFAADQIFELDPCHTGACVQLCSMYAIANMWEEVATVREKMKEGGFKNRIGWSCFEIAGMVHEFLVGANSHPSIKEIHSTLRGIDSHVNSAYCI